MASRLLLVPRSSRRIQWLSDFVSLRSRAGAASLWLTTMSMSPSLSMSPNAAPRPTCLVSKYGPASRVARRKSLPLQVEEERGGSA